jgi:hypothetical protein
VVLEALWVLAVATPLSDPLVHQGREALAEDVGGDPPLLLDLVEAPPAEEELGEDDQGPALAEDGEGRAIEQFCAAKDSIGM